MNYLKRFLTLALLTLILFSTQHTALANAPQINLPKIGETSIENRDSILLSDQRTIVSGTRGGELVFIDSKTTQILNKVKVTDNLIYKIVEQNKDNIIFTTNPSKVWVYTISTGETKQIHSANTSSDHNIWIYVNILDTKMLSLCQKRHPFMERPVSSETSQVEART